MRKLIACWLLLFSSLAFAGAQIYEPLSASVRAVMQKAVSDKASPRLAFVSEAEAKAWLDEMSRRLGDRIPDAKTRKDFLTTAHYEATRAGLDPQLVLGLIQVESRFRKYAVSKAGARGYMQVMPFWVKEIGAREHNLFHLRTNLRYGCTILRYYLDKENGDLFRALGRYNGSLGQSNYPNRVVRTWISQWKYPLRGKPSRVQADQRVPFHSVQKDFLSPTAFLEPHELFHTLAGDRADMPHHHFAMRAENEGGGQTVHPADLRGDFVIAEHHRIGHEQVVGKLDDRLRVFVFHGDADDFDLFAVRFIQRHQAGNFLETRRAPGRPEIHQHPFALIIAEAVSFTFGVSQNKALRLGRV